MPPRSAPTCGCRGSDRPLSAYLGLDLGGTRIRCIVADASAELPRILGRDDRPTPRSGPEDVVRELARSAAGALAAAGLPLATVRMVACSAPGPLDPRRGIVHEAPNLAGMVEFPLAARLSAALGDLAVVLDHDTAMAAIGEALAGAARNVADFVYLTVSTGLGGKIVSGGRMIRGVRGTAGELGHFPVALEGPRCGCGSFGCAESFAAGRNLAEQFGVHDAAEVYAAALDGDARAAALVARAEAALGNLAVGLANALNPALLVVGGSVAEHQPGHVLEPMRRAIAARAFRVPAGSVKVVPAGLGADVGLLGAVIAARERVDGRDGWFS